MPSLSDRLKSLGVELGPGKIQQPKTSPGIRLEKAVPGQFHETPEGRVFLVEESFPPDHRFGKTLLASDAPLAMLAAWAKQSRVADLSPGDFAFIDTEASGLSIGAGTFVTWITVGRFEAEEFRVTQLFLHDPFEEGALLAAFERCLAGCQAIVTYNGKSFDVPLLNNRFQINRRPTPLKELAHVDLVHLARRLWRDRLPERKLGTLEKQILGMERSSVDVPGYMVPEIYKEYLHEDRVDRLEGVFYHNKIDVLALAALMYHMAGMLAEPLEAVDHDLDILAIGKLYQDLGYTDRAREIYLYCLGQPLPQELWLETARRLSFLYKRQENLPEAMKLWQVAAERGEIYAHVELAKVCEHKQKDFSAALSWTKTALKTVSAADYPFIERLRWKSDLEHRLARLERKQRKAAGAK